MKKISSHTIMLPVLLTIGLVLSCEKPSDSPRPASELAIANVQDFWEMVERPDFQIQEVSSQAKEEISETLIFSEKGLLRGFGSQTFFEDVSEIRRTMFTYLLLGYAWEAIYDSSCSCSEVDRLIDKPCIEIEENRTFVSCSIPEEEPCLLPESCSEYKEHFICIR